MRASTRQRGHSLYLLALLENSALGIWIRESEWGYPIVLICHTLGMACLVGVVTAFTLRIALANSETSLAWFHASFRLAWLGFTINLISGLVLFSGSPQRFIANPAFQSKLLALAIGAVTLRFLSTSLARCHEHHVLPSRATRSLAIVTLLLWFAAIAAGRLIAYLR